MHQSSPYGKLQKGTHCNRRLTTLSDPVTG